MSYFSDIHYINKLEDCKAQGLIPKDVADYAIAAINERLDLITELSKLKFPNYTD